MCSLQAFQLLVIEFMDDWWRNEIFTIKYKTFSLRISDNFFCWTANYTGEYLALTGAQFDGVEMVPTSLATHYVMNKVFS